MSLISSDFPPDTENGVLNWFGGIGRAILGNSQKFLAARQWTRINQRVILMDFSYGNLMAVAQNTPHLNVILSKGAEMFSNMKIKHVDKNGKEIINSDVIRLLSKPNPLETMDAWLYKFYIYNGIYNNCFGYKNYARQAQYRGKDLPSFLWWLPTGEMEIKLSGKIYRQNRVEDIIEGYKMFLDPTMYTPDEIIYMTEGISANGVSCGTRLEALQIPLSNIVAALKSKNIVISEMGMKGFISNGGAKDAAGTVFDSKEAERAEKDWYKKRSLDREGHHISFTSNEIKWVSMGFDVGQMQLHEGLENDFAILCAAYGHDRDIYPSIKGATFENKEQGLKFTYQNTIQPLADKLMLQLEIHLGLQERGENLIADYSWLPIMKEDALKEEEARFYKTQSCSMLLKDGVISHNQYAQIMDVDMDGTGEIVAPSPLVPINKPKEPPKSPNT